VIFVTDYRESWDIRSKNGSLCFASAIYARLVGGDQDETELLWLAEYLRVNSAALAQPEPEGVTDEELKQLAWTVHADAQDDDQCGDVVVRVCRAAIAADRARYARPTIKPVPVAERPWEREGWCDAEGRCWWGVPAGIVDPDDERVSAACWALVGAMPNATHWLPHHALPLPQP